MGFPKRTKLQSIRMKFGVLVLVIFLGVISSFTILNSRRSKSEKNPLMSAPNQTQITYLRFVGDEELDEYFKDSEMTGTQYNPYVFENLVFNLPSNQPYFSLINTTRNVVIQDCVFSGNESRTLTAISLSNSHSVELEYNDISGMKTGIQIIDSSHLVDLNYNDISNCNSGIELQESQIITIQNCYVFNISGSGINSTNGINHNYNNNKIYENLGHGMHIANIETVSIEGNEVHFNNLTGITMRDVQGFTIQNNLIHNNTLDGLYLENCTSGDIFTNEISENQGNGISTTRCWDLFFNNNDCTQNSESGISSAEDNDCSYSHNSFSGNGNDGINILGGIALNIFQNDINLNLGNGISFDGVSNSRIKDNDVNENSGSGISFEGISTNNDVEGNSLFDNVEWGLDISDSAKDNDITDNLFDDIADAINPDSGDNNNFFENIVENFNSDGDDGGKTKWGSDSSKDSGGDDIQWDWFDRDKSERASNPSRSSDGFFSSLFDPNNSSSSDGNGINPILLLILKILGIAVVGTLVVYTSVKYSIKGIKALAPIVSKRIAMMIEIQRIKNLLNNMDDYLTEEKYQELFQKLARLSNDLEKYNLIEEEENIREYMRICRVNSVTIVNMNSIKEFIKNDDFKRAYKYCFEACEETKEDEFRFYLNSNLRSDLFNLLKEVSEHIDEKDKVV